MTWEDVSRDAMKAARTLLSEKRLRSAVSRSYYAAYAAAAGRLQERGVNFGYGGNNPTHEQLPHLILHNLNVPMHERRRVAGAVRRLRFGRVEADYMPSAYLDDRIARDFVRDAGHVLDVLEIDDDEG